MEYVPLTDCPKCNGVMLDGNWCIDCDTRFRYDQFGKLEEIPGVETESITIDE